MKKFTNSISVEDFEVLTDRGFEDIKKLHTTIEYEVYILKTENYTVKCADNHLVFNENYEAIFVKDLKVGQKIVVSSGFEEITLIEKTGQFEEMFDLELNEGNRRYFTNGILSHNTETVKSLANYYFGSEDSIIRIDMSEYQEKFNVSKLIGAPPGYVGYESGGQLTEAVRRKPYSVVLFDEVEKAHPDTFNTLLQVLDEGRLTDSLGRTIDFTNTIIIMTSNVGAKRVAEFGSGIGFSGVNSIATKKMEVETIIRKELKNKFAPEFLNRLDDIVLFDGLKEEHVLQIVDIEINHLKSRMEEQGYSINVLKNAKVFLAERGYDAAYGARPLKRAIQNYVEDLLADEIIEGNMVVGKSYTVSHKKGDDKLFVK